MPLLLLDLDDSLIERTAAFARWARAFAASTASPDLTAAWLIEADRDGGEHRPRLAAMICDRLGLGAGQRDDVLAQIRQGLLDNLELDPAVPRALDRARAAGWIPYVITNGTARQQEAKLRRTGLDEHVAGWVISEAAGFRKPDPRIFRLAARNAGQPLTGAWMIGDSPEADIAGAHHSGLLSVWLHRSREWTLASFAPTLACGSCPDAIDAVLAAAATRP